MCTLKITKRLPQALLFACLLSSPALAWAQEDYDTLVETAGEKFASEDYEGAIADFKRAYDLKKTPNIVYNIGRIEEKRGRFEEAVTYYETFVNEPDIGIDARTDALRRIKALREILAMRKQKEADAEAKRLAELEKNKPKKVTPPPAPDRTLSYAFLGTGVAALAAGGVFAFLTDATATEFAQATTLEERRAAASTGGTYALASDSLLIAGGAFTVVGVALFLLAGSDDSSAPTTLLIAPTVRPDGAGVGMQWSF